MTGLLLFFACATEPEPAATVALPAAPFVPAACYARTRTDDGRVRNPCWTCHQQPRTPNFVDDAELQLAYAFPQPAAQNPWRTPAAPVDLDDDALLARIREDNYRDADGRIRLVAALADLPPTWDSNGNGRWDGFVPDLFLDPDDRGHDRAPDGTPTGWRVYRYRPLPGGFWPTNGGAWGDGWIRLPEAFRTDADGRPDAAVYEENLAILEAALTRRPVAVGDRLIPPARARSGLVWVGQAGVRQAGGDLGPPTAGLYPVGTELLHGLRYLDPQADGVRPAARWKELRYLRRTTASTYADLADGAAEEARERRAFPERLKQVGGDLEHGVPTGTGWRLQGFVEDATGELRPQTRAETAFCAGCHGGIGAGVDSTFSFARKLPGDDGWGGGDYAVPDLQRADGRWEAELYLETTGSGDDFGTNPELAARWFVNGELDRRAIAETRVDLRPLIVPSPARALALNRAYLGLVETQAFGWNRDPAPTRPDALVHDTVAADLATGVQVPVAPAWVR